MYGGASGILRYVKFGICYQVAVAVEWKTLLSKQAHLCQVVVIIGSLFVRDDWAMQYVDIGSCC